MLAMYSMYWCLSQRLDRSDAESIIDFYCKILLQDKYKRSKKLK